MPIKRFWAWFAANADRLKGLYANGRFEDLTQEMNRELDRVEPQLAWEMGPGKQKPYLLTIFSEGNCDLSRRCTRGSSPADGRSVTETSMRAVEVVML